MSTSQISLAPVGLDLFRAGVVAILTLGFLPAAQAATVQVVSGEVLVNQGNGYKRTMSEKLVKAGDTVMVKKDGSARIVYSNGCFIRVPEGVVRVVVTDEQCQLAPVNTAAPHGAFVAPTAGQLVVGGAIIAGGVTAGVLIAQKDKSTSP